MLETKFESLQNAWSEMEIEQDICYILAMESHDLLNGTKLIAYDYECANSGVYGNDIEVNLKIHK